MLYRENIAVRSEIRKKHIHTVCQSREFFNIKSSGTYSNHQALKSQHNFVLLLFVESYGMNRRME